MESDINLIYEFKPGKLENLMEMHDFEEFLQRILHGKKVDLVNAWYVIPVVEQEISNKILCLAG